MRFDDLRPPRSPNQYRIMAPRSALLGLLLLGVPALPACHRSDGAAGASTGGEAGGTSPGETGGSSGGRADAAIASTPTPPDATTPPDGPAAPNGPAPDAAAPDQARDLAAAPAGDGSLAGASAPAALVASLSIERFKSNIKTVSALGDRTQGSPSFDAGAAWLEKQLTDLGYTVEHQPYVFLGQPRISIFTTKVGSKSPDRMYLVMAHLDGRGGGGGADDDGSGTSLALEVARALAQPGVETDTSVRFCFWNNEETGLDGSAAYVRARVMRQGVEDPPGSHRFPEPKWLGAIMHDMILFDHGFPPGPNQSPTADINVDYQAAARASADGKALAQTLAAGGMRHAHDYPVTVGSTMDGTDSVSFQDFTASVSVREAKRDEEILRGSNPNHHQPTDVYATYSEADFRLGFNALELTTGTVAELAGATIAGKP
jgi:hypothetical protein